MFRRIRQRREHNRHERELAYEALALVRELPYPNTFHWEKAERIDSMRIVLRTGDIVVGEITDKVNIIGNAGDSLDVTLDVSFVIDGAERESSWMVLIPSDELRIVSDTVTKFRCWRAVDHDDGYNDDYEEDCDDESGA